MREIPSGYMELIPAMSTVQPCDWDMQGVISVLRDGHNSPGRGPPQPALPLKLALLSAGASRGTIQAKSCCNFVTMQSLAKRLCRVGVLFRVTLENFSEDFPEKQISL